MNLNDKFRLFRDGGNVTRFHTKNLNKSQDNAQHSFNCALMANEFAAYYDDVGFYNVVMAMLVHDIPETAIGDSPHDTKNYNPDIKAALEVAEEKWFTRNLPDYRRFHYDLNENEDYVCRLADQMEALFKSIEELELGNKQMGICVTYIFKHIESSLYPKGNVLFERAFYSMMDEIQTYLKDVHNIHV